MYLLFESRASNRALPHVARVLLDSRAHIVALQELRDRRQLGRLIEILLRAEPGWRGWLSEDATDRRAALLSRLPCDFFAVPTSSGRVFPAATLVRGGWSAVSVHLDAFSARRRQKQLAETVLGMQMFGNTNILLFGDFNFDPRKDAEPPCIRPFVDGGAGAGATSLYGLRLDHVRYFCPSRWQSHARVLSRRRRGLMDHDPLLVELSPDS